MISQANSKLRSPSYRRSLPRQYRNHVFMISNGRALIYRKPQKKPAYWLARLITKEHTPVMKLLGPANDTDGSSGDLLAFDEAHSLAIEWFNHPKQRSVGIEDRPLGPCRELIVCPIGKIYTVAHALNDYLE